MGGMLKTDATQLALSVKGHTIKELVVSRTFERLIIWINFIKHNAWNTGFVWTGYFLTIKKALIVKL